MASEKMHTGKVRVPPSQSRWVVVASLATISFIIGGSSSVAIGILINRWMIELGWPNGLTSSIATGFTLAVVFVAPGVGVALDKLGARPVMTFGVLAASTGFLMVSRCHTPYGMLAAFVLAGIGCCASFSVPSAVVVTNWMESQKSLGMGIVLGATSVGAALFSVLIGRWSEAYGWRVTMELIAALVAAMIPFTLLTVRTRPQRHPKSCDHASEHSDTGRGRRDLLLSATFIIATASSALFAIAMSGIYFHVVSVLIKAGYSAYLAGLVFGATWLLSALGSLMLGVIAERLGAKTTLAGALFSCALGTLFLVGAGGARIGVACVVAFIVLWGTSANSVAQFVPVIFVERFGSQHLGTLIGVQFAIMGVAGASAPVVTGLLYDKFADYRPAIYLSTSTAFLAFVLVLLINVCTCESGASILRKSRATT